MKRLFWPDTILVENSALEDDLTKRVLSRLKSARVIELEDGAGDPLVNGAIPGVSYLDEIERFSRGKRLLFLKRFKGNWLCACPGTSGHVCCNLWTVNPGEGCPLDCTYCYLQSYLRRNPTLKIYTNVNDMLKEIDEKSAREPNRLFRIGTGEIIDSLVWDELTDLSCEMVPFFAKRPNLMLELKTKFSFVDNLLKLKDEHLGHTVVSWSVNAQSISSKDEAFTASLEERIFAAEKVANAGYKVGFHFDPLVYFDGWEEEYLDTINLIFSKISAEQIAWISISSLRYQPDMQEIMIKRFPDSGLPFGEQFVGSDNKLRYVQPIRFRMLNFVWRELKAKSATLPVYMCMESSAAWRNIAGGLPVAGEELSEVFSRRGKLPILGPSKNEATASFFGPKRAIARSANKAINMFELNTETD